jgi:hypothetical protein
VSAGAVIVAGLAMAFSLPAAVDAQVPDSVVADPQIPETDIREPERLLTGADLVDDDFLGSWPMFGRDTRMKIGGYVKADFLYDHDGTLDRQQLLMSTIPVQGTEEYGGRGYFNAFAYESRINFDVRRIATDRPPLRLFVEGDFWPSGGGLRLRHAYIAAGDFIFGQTWTTLSVLESLIISIEFAAGDALFGGRTAQARYQRKLNDRWTIAAGLEQLPFLGIENPEGQPGEASQLLPLLAVRTDYRWDGGLLVFGSSVAQLRWDGGLSGPYATALQWDLLVAGRKYFGADYAVWNIAYGHGSGENILAFAGSQANAVLTPSGELETMPAFSLVMGYAHHWKPGLVTNASYAYGWLQTPPSREPLALRKGGIAHVNLVWYPVPSVSTGIEYAYGLLRSTSNAFGDASRWQAMVRFDF